VRRFPGVRYQVSGGRRQDGRRFSVIGGRLSIGEGKKISTSMFNVGR